MSLRPVTSVVLHFCLVISSEESTADCISTAACGATASGRRSGRDAEISTDGSSIGQPDCAAQTQEKTEDSQRSNETFPTVQTAENR